MLCLKASKHVLCEKSFTLNARQAHEAADYAQARGLYLAEAMWTRHMPSRAMIDNIIASGIIGKPHVLTANLSYNSAHVPRITRPELAGGALLDLGVYGLNFAMMHFGDDITRIETSAQLTDTGVDAMESITLHYADGRMAVLTHGVYARSDRQGIIYGEKGYLVVRGINNPQGICVYDDADNLLAQYDIPAQISGYEYEFLEAERCIREGKTQSDSTPLSHTLRIMELMDELRARWGVVYPQEL
jgi:predicted dehydrogenase